jgi:hypothetical protein
VYTWDHLREYYCEGLIIWYGDISKNGKWNLFEDENVLKTTRNLPVHPHGIRRVVWHSVCKNASVIIDIENATEKC